MITEKISQEVPRLPNHSCCVSRAPVGKYFMAQSVVMWASVSTFSLRRWSCFALS